MAIQRSAWLSALAAFEAAARHQNFAHAADELHLTASAVSHHVRKLEGLLGVSLFQRHARGVALTAEGRRLADAAGNALADLDAVFASVRPQPGTAQVRLATLHSFASAWLLPRLPDFAAANPQIRVAVETEIALTRFDPGGPDLGVRHGPGAWPGLAAEHLLDEWMFPVVAPDFPGRSTATDAAAIARLPLIADLARQGWQDWFRAAGAGTVRLPAMHTFTDSTDALEAAACGLGAALARSRIVAPWLRSGRLVRLPGPAMAARFGYYLIHPLERRLSEPAQALARWLSAQARADAGVPDDAPSSAPVRQRVR
jgi:LysR family glycine cleavage system transcriptional activator